MRKFIRAVTASGTGPVRGSLSWLLLAAVTFWAIYPTCSWLSDRREALHHLYGAWELSIPLVPGFIWPYISMYLVLVLPPFFLGPHRQRVLATELMAATLLAGTLYLLFPSTLGFTRTLPGSPVYDGLFRFMFSIDGPYNLWPSLHVLYSALILTALTEKSRPACRLGAWIWLALICLSTVFVHQHHLLDVVSGLILAGCIRALLRP